jgi:hypothetical protein
MTPTNFLLTAIVVVLFLWYIEKPSPWGKSTRLGPARGS